MFSMIIVIIAIALVIVLAGAALYYGGESWSDGRAKADAAKYRNQASQIVAAINLYKTNEGGIPNTFSLQELVDEGYLKDMPEGAWAPQPNTTLIVRTGVPPRTCVAANESVGYTFLMTDPGADANYVSAGNGKGVPKCSWSGLDSGTPCCDNTDDEEVGG